MTLAEGKVKEFRFVDEAEPTGRIGIGADHKSFACIPVMVRTPVTQSEKF